MNPLIIATSQPPNLDLCALHKDPSSLLAKGHGFGIGLPQVGPGQINRHHELQFEATTQVIQKGILALQAKAIQRQLTSQRSKDSFTLGG